MQSYFRRPRIHMHKIYYMKKIYNSKYFTFKTTSVIAMYTTQRLAYQFEDLCETEHRNLPPLLCNRKAYSTLPQNEPKVCLIRSQNVIFCLSFVPRNLGTRSWYLSTCSIKNKDEISFFFFQSKLTLEFLLLQLLLLPPKL